MLVLSRKPGQKICIGDQIEVTILDVRGSRVRLGVEAPRELSIDRDDWRARMRVTVEVEGSELTLAQASE